MASQGTVRRPVLADRWEYDPRIVFAAGSNAQTFAGRDLDGGDEVVVKIFSHAAGGRGRERFLREARLHEELEHEAVLELLGQGQDGGVDYIITRRLRPGALGDIVRQRSRLSPAAALAIGLRIADALDYMHGRNEVHGDISPGNILLDGGEGDAAYLADFGFSKRMATAPVATTGDGFGTPGFSLPRELGAQRTYEDDVYGLAAVLWFCLSGEPPADSPRARRREISSRSLRSPLNRALAWETGSIPTAAEFKESLTRHWAKVGQDWRAVSSPPQRSRLPMAVVAGLAGLAVAGLFGQTLQPKPAAAAQTTIEGRGVSLHLAGKWKPRQAPRLSALRLRAPVAAASNSSVIVAGRAPSAGPQLISRDARASLPPAARKPTPVLINQHAALRYGSTAKFGVAQEILALPLERDVLVVRCTGSAAPLARVCAQAVADVELRNGSVQPLAPMIATARPLRAATTRLGAERQQQRSLLATTSSRQALAATAEKLASANRSYADRITTLPTTAQDANSVGAAASAARATAAAYADLARAGSTSAWSSAQAEVDRREKELDGAIRRLGSLRVYGN
jgi:serine/threonine-protein kinase